MPASTDYGLIRVNGKFKFVTQIRVLRADAKDGDIEVTLVDGKKIRAYHEDVKRWPSHAVEVDQ